MRARVSISRSARPGISATTSMRVCAGVEAAMDCGFAADSGRIVCEVRAWNCFAVKRKRSRASFRRCAWFVLEKGQADQSNDRDPDNRIRHNNAVPKSAAGKIVLLQHAAVCMFSDHRRLPGKRFRDKRLVSCGRFGLLEIRDHRRICYASMPTLASADYEAAFSFQRTMLFKTTVNVPRLHRFDAAPV